MVAIIVLSAALLLGLSRIESVILLMLVAMVMVAELINTSVEATIDLVVDKHNPLAKIAKDVAAAAVLVAATAAVLIGYFLFVDHLNQMTLDALISIRRAPVHLTFIALLLVFLITLGIKATTGRATLQGGMPSIHAGLAAAAAVAIIFITGNPLVAGLSLLMTLLVMESRVEAGIHSTAQVLAGALLGGLITVIVFQLMR